MTAPFKSSASRRRSVSLRYVLCGFLALATYAAEPLLAADQPNIILIVADDLGYGDVGYHGSTQIETPHIDALADSGLAMSQGYVSSPVCGPSRAGLITGRNQVSFGFDNNMTANAKGFDPEYAGLPTQEATLAKRLQDSGYYTGIVGKWHLGELPRYHPLKRGFDEFWGFIGGGHPYFSTVAQGKDEPKLESNLAAPPQIGTYLTDDLGTQAVGFIERNKKRPFFLYAAFNAPHGPLQATQEDLKKFSFIEDKDRRTYCAMVHRLDVNVGRIKKAVTDAGLAENTMIVFLSDNGGPVDQNASLNAPLNGQKGILLEGGIRVPFIVSWPGTLPAGESYDEPVSSLDLAPTFVEMAGRKAVKKAAFDGVDLLPYLKGERPGAPHDELMWRFTISAAVREGNWKLVRLPDRLPLLFDLSKDPSELNNVAMDNLDVTQALLKRLGQWDVTLPNPLFMESAVWRKRQLNLYDSQFPLTQPARGETPLMISHGRTH